MPRYTGPARFRLSSPAARPYEEAGRELMGELLERGVAVLSDRRVLEDGAIVAAHLRGSQRIIDLVAPPPAGATQPGLAQQALMLGGFVTKPRLRGETNDPIPIDITNGENAYGERAHVILRDRRPAEVFPDWMSYFYDADYRPPWHASDKLYKEGRAGVVFPTGLVAHANVDWRDRSEKYSVTWVGPPGRSIGAFGYLSAYVCHNGRLILDLWTPQDEEPSAIDADRAVSCACLREIDGDLWLYWLAVPFETEEGQARLCRAKLRPHPDITWWPFVTAVGCPQFAQVALADVEEVCVTEIDIGSRNIYGWGVGAFNQSATEMRVLYHLFDITGDNARHVVIEVAIDFSGEEVEIETTTYEQYVLDETSYGTHTWGANATLTTTIEWTDPTPSGPPPGPTTEIWPMDPQEHIGSGFFLPNSGANPRLVYPRAGSSSHTLTQIGDDLPLAIDFREDVPVRLWWRPCDGVATIEFTANWVNTDVRSGSRTVDYDGFSETVVGEHNEHDISYEYTESSNSLSTLSGGLLYVQVDGEDERRLELQFSSTRSLSSSVNSVGEAHHVGDMDSSLAWTVDNTAQMSLDATMATEFVSVTHQLWWIDMRYDAWVTLKEEYNYDYGGTRADEGSEDWGTTEYGGGLLTQNNSAPPWVSNVSVVSSVTGTSESKVTVSVVMFGEEAMSKTLTNSVPVSYSPVTTYNARTRADINVAPPTSGVVTSGVTVAAGGLGAGFGASLAGASGATAEAIRTTILGDPPVVAQVFDETDTTPAGAAPSESLNSEPDLFAMALESDTLWSIFDGTKLSGLFGQSWLVRGVDSDVRTPLGLAVPKAYGTWIAYRGRWAYSFPWPASMEEIATPRWESAIEGEVENTTQTLHDLTGTREPLPELYATMWPLSRCITYLPPGFTAADLKGF